MIGSSPFKTIGGYIDTTNRTADRLKKYANTAALRQKAGLEGDVDDGSFASKLRKADEYQASGESCGATDSIGIMIRRMDEPTPGHPVVQDYWHNGAHVSITRDTIFGNTIRIGGSVSPDLIHVSTSVGTVIIDLNDMTSLMKCLDLFSPEDIDAIMKKITEVKQAREALSQIDQMEDELVRDDKEEEGNGGDGGEKSIGEAVGVVSAEEQKHIEEKRGKKFIG